ncbi:MAG: hypothetical protein H6842_06370 [Rhodospirillaceae bacterium]|nr:hypothetical protein [Rhodospirillaceae bacterium]
MGPMSWCCPTGPVPEAPPYRPDPDVVANLDRLVGLAAATDLFVVIAVRTGPRRSEFTFFHGEEGTWFDAGYINEDGLERPCGPGRLGSPMARYLADRYRDLPAVVGYDLMVRAEQCHRLRQYDPRRSMPRIASNLADWNTLFPRDPAIAPPTGCHPDPAGPDGPCGPSPALPWLADPGDDRVVIGVHQYDPLTSPTWTPAGARYPGQAVSIGTVSPIRSIVRPCSACWIRWTPRGRRSRDAEFGAARWAPGASRFLDDEMTAFRALGVNRP